MQYRTLGDLTLSRLCLGTKRMPTEDSHRVVHLDEEVTTEIFSAAADEGINCLETSYSHHKGEAESFIGEYAQSLKPTSRPHVMTGYLELIDPNYEYVLQKQLKKLACDRIDLYVVEGVCDITRMRDIDSGAVDFFFEQKERGTIGYVGFSSELSPENLAAHLDTYPWDFVRMEINYYDWFNKGLEECYAVAATAGVPIIAHGALRCGPSSTLKPEALQVLRETGIRRTSTEWALRFAKSLGMVTTVSCNMHSTREVKHNAEAFADDELLTDDELEVLRTCAETQKNAMHR